MKSIITLIIFFTFLFSFSQSYKPNSIDNKKIIKKILRKLTNDEKKREIEIITIYWMNLKKDTLVNPDDYHSVEYFNKNLEFIVDSKKFKKSYSLEGIITSKDKKINKEFQYYPYLGINFYSFSIYASNLLNVYYDKKIKYVFRVGNISGYSGNSDYFIVDDKGSIYVLVDDTIVKAKPNFNIIELENYYFEFDKWFDTSQ